MADPSLSLEIGHWRKVLPFWVSYLLFPLIWASAILGGWWVLLTPLLAWYLFSLLDLAFGLSHANENPATDVLLWQATDGPLCCGCLHSSSVFLGY